MANLLLNEPEPKAKSQAPVADRSRTPLEVPAIPNHTWSLDFMSDTLYSGHRYRILNIIDEGVREALNITVGTSLSSKRVVRVLEGIVLQNRASQDVLGWLMVRK